MINVNGNHPKFGEVYLIKFEGVGNEQSGWRPGMVFQNNIGNKYSPNIIALPLTTSLKKVSQPTHVLINSRDSGLLKDSMVLCENPERISKDRIGMFITKLPHKYIKKIAIASILTNSSISFITLDELINAYNLACDINSDLI